MLSHLSGTFCHVVLGSSPVGPWCCSSSAPVQVSSRVFTQPRPQVQNRPRSNRFTVIQKLRFKSCAFLKYHAFNPSQSGRSFCTAKARSSQTLTRCARRSRRRRIESPEPTREYHPSPSTCGFSPLTVRCLRFVSESCDISESNLSPGKLNQFSQDLG